MTPLRIIFMGTPDLAATSLEALLAAGDFEIAAIATQPDRPRGRELKLTPSPVKQIAQSAGKPVLQPLKARDPEFILQLAAFQPDLIAVAAFGQILPPDILLLPRLGCLNVHTSLLPRWRGASPIQSALLHGDVFTGITIMKMDAGLDTGDILMQRTIRIEPQDNAQTLHDRLAKLGAELLVETIRELAAGKIQPHPQPADGVTHAAKIRREDGQIRWQEPARKILNRLRAFTPWPGIFTHLPASAAAPDSAGPLLKILSATITELTGVPGQIVRADKEGILVACGNDSLRITELQREGGRRMSAADFLAGHPLQPGDTLGNR